MIEVLYVGGTWDKTITRVSSVKPYYEVPVYDLNDPHASLLTELYRTEKFICGERMWYLAIHTSWSLEAAIDHVFRSYADE